MIEENAAKRLSPDDARRRARELIKRDGQTFAEQAGIDLVDESGPLWQLVVLTNLLSNRIRSETAIASAAQLWSIGCATPAGTRASSWQQRVDALGRGGYRRYDFSTATRLGRNADLIAQQWDDDLRSLHEEAKRAEASKNSAAGASTARQRVEVLIQQFDGIGPAGARIFLREAQGVWPNISPVVDPLVQRGARKAGLPEEAAELEELAGNDLPRLCAALVRLAKRR